MRTMENENKEYILRVYGALQEKGYMLTRFPKQSEQHMRWLLHGCITALHPAQDLQGQYSRMSLVNYEGLLHSRNGL